MTRLINRQAPLCALPHIVATGPAANLLSRLQKGPTSADIARARPFLRQFFSPQIGFTRFHAKEIVGDDDAEQLLDTVDRVSLTESCYELRWPTQPVDIIVTSGLLVAWGVFVCATLRAVNPSLFERVWPKEKNPALYCNRVSVRDMPGGGAVYPDDIRGPRAWHRDRVWARGITHLRGVHAGTQFLDAQGVPQYLNIGETLLLSGMHRKGVVATTHACPSTAEARRIAVIEMVEKSGTLPSCPLCDRAGWSILK